MTDPRLNEDVRIRATSLYTKQSVLVLRRDVYNNFAFHQQGDYRSVYMTRGMLFMFILRLIRELVRP